jgi:hypothetical protein
MISVGKGRFRILAEEKKTEDGAILMVFGGKTHVGSVVLAEPRPSRTDSGTSCTSQVLNRLGHKDESIARMFAEEICKARGEPVLCVCGIHIENASKSDIKKLEKNAKELLKKCI